MRIALITDTHWGIRNDSHVFYDYMKKSSDYFFEYLRKNKIKKIIHLGDLYERRKYVNFITAARCRKDFLEVVDAEFEMDVIAGNHDIYHKNTNDINSLQELVRGYSNIHVHMSPVTKKYGKRDILLLPWICPSNYDESMEAINRTPAKTCFGHLELNGFEISKGDEYHGGMESKIFDKFELVGSGHFHHRSTKGNITYLGAAHEFIWSDWNDDRGFNIYDTETNTLEFIKNPYSMFHMIVYDDANQMQSIRDDIDNKDFSIYKNSYIKIVALKKNNAALFDQFLDKLYQAEVEDVTIIEDINLFTDESEEELNAEGETTVSIINKYIDSINMELNPIKTKKYMMDIYMEAIAMEKTNDN